MCDRKYTTRILPLARDDLRETKSYLSRFYPKTASKVLGELKAKINKLSENPLIYEKYTDDPFYRRMIVSNYLVFYHINEDQRIIEVHRVLRGAWDIRQYLNDHR